jgi:hypothetical protein
MTTSTAQPCDRLADLFVDLRDEPGLLSAAEAEHVSQCLRCQAEMARSRRLDRALASLRNLPLQADPAVLESILERLDTAVERRERQRIAGRRAASIVGFAAATAAGVGGVLVLATRRRSA